MAKDLNDHIKKSHIKALEKFNAELLEFEKETGEKPVTLYEDANISFTLADIHLENGWLKFDYDGQPDSVRVVTKDPLDRKYYEEELDGIMDYVTFWRKCLKRAKKFWSMDPDKLDAIQNGEAEYHEEEEDEV